MMILIARAALAVATAAAIVAVILAAIVWYMSDAPTIAIFSG